MSGRALRIAIRFALWLPILLHLLTYAYDPDLVRNRYFCCVQFSAFAGISQILWQRTFKFSPWIYVLLVLRRVLKQNLFFHLAYCNIPTRVCNERRPRKLKRADYGNLAFGGRGPPHVVRGSRSFDSTLGYPGEGWPKLTLATWNTRSLTFERFKA